MTPADKVIIVGAGMAGIAMAVQLKRQLSHENFEIFEQMDDVGGTWAQNTYPNLSCDVASQVSTLSSITEERSKAEVIWGTADRR